jgi:DNA end-binding protein Ku
MRAVWTGSIGFGLVSIPVRLYPAVSPKDPQFHLIDRATGRRVRNRRVVRDTYEPPPPLGDQDEPIQTTPPAEATEQSQPRPPSAPDESPVSQTGPAPATARERAVESEELVRGFEIEKGRHVVVEQEELEALRPEQTRTIEIEHFVSLEEIDPVFFEKSYHVAPADEIAEKPYHLLRKAMEDEGRVAIGRFVMRTREHLVAVRSTLGILGLETLYFADEVREPLARWTSTDAPLRKAELEMAKRLIETMHEPWDPARYRDPYRERVLELVRQREGLQDVVEEEADEGAAPSAVPDLMAALKASVEQLSSKETKKRKPRRSAG